MKNLSLIILINISFCCSFSQTYSGQLLDKQSGQQIPFANIGITGKNIGTVSDAVGWFKIELDRIFDQDSLCISCIGYEKQIYLISEFKNDIENIDQVKIELSPKSYHLEEIIIQPDDTKIFNLGNYCESNSPYGNAFYSDKLGTEMGVIIELP